MDSSILEIASNLLNSKRFNSLAFSVAIAALVVWYFNQADLIWLFIGLVFAIYSLIAIARYTIKRVGQYRKSNKEKFEKNIQIQKNIEQSRNEQLALVSPIFQGLSEKSKQNLAYIVLKGEKDLVYSNRFIFKHGHDYHSKIYFALYQAREATSFDGNGIFSRSLVVIEELNESSSVVIDYVLLEFINNYISDNHLTLSSYEQQDK